jgi:hypothetical protein
MRVCVRARVCIASTPLPSTAEHHLLHDVPEIEMRIVFIFIVFIFF